MLCEYIRGWFNDYLDGDLKLKRKNLVDEHLAGCSQCRQEFDKMQHVDDRLRQEIKFMFAEIPVPEGLCERIEDRVGRAGYRAPFFERLRPFGRYAGVAAALLVFVAAYGLFQQHFSGIPIQNMMIDQPSRVMVENAGTGIAGGLPEGAASPPAANSGGIDSTLEDSARTAETSDTSAKVALNHVAGVLEQLAAPTDSAPGGTALGASAADGDTGVSDRALLPKAGDAPNTDKTAAPNTGQSTGSGGAMASQISSKATQPAGGETLMRTATVPNSETYDLAGGSDGTSLSPGYLPEGANLTNIESWGVAVRLNYTAGESNFYIEARPAQDSYASALSSAGQVIRLKNHDGLLHNPSPSGGVTLTWEQGGQVITVHGNLPEPELIKIAESL
ncbi:MAG: hypothetical protein A4E53_03258 [Pelotomaculum sp. PtaB.Bin104]|nr:MAG: hypothetical protein A4E53_03258 [Pelotomaculum sp. PtaB.Bin104]